MSRWIHGLLMVWMAAVVSPAVAQFGISAELRGYDPQLLLVNQQVDVEVRVRNTGADTYMQMQLEEKPSQWSVDVRNDSFVYIGNGDTETFDVRINPGSATGTYTLKLKMRAEDLNGLVVDLTTFNLDFDVDAPPGNFFIIEPTQNVEVAGEFQIAWSGSENADSYDLYIAEYENGSPQYPARFRIQDIQNTFYFFDAEQLEPGERYEILLYAKNRAGVTPNSDGARAFNVAGPDPLGSFSITAPSQNGETGIAPTITWGVSSNADEYAVYFFREVNGAPERDPFRTKEGLTAPTYTLEEPFLEGGKYYYVSVRSFDTEFGQSLLNANGQIRFYATALSDFTLTIPGDGLQKVSLTPDFRWNTTPGASHYEFFLYEYINEAEQYQVNHTIVPQAEGFVIFFLPQNKQLINSTNYLWYVEAVRGSERLRNADGPRVFRTTELANFELISPETAQPDVEPVPTFSWEPTQSATGYFVELAPTDGYGRPVLIRSMQSPSVTTTEWESTFNELDRGRQYAWRVGASDGTNIRFNYGGWQTFTVSPLTPFGLTSPEDGAEDVGEQPVLRWEGLANAEAYRVYITVPRNGYGLPPITVTTNAVNLETAGYTLNSLTDYNWTVEAMAGGTTRLADDVWSFTTGERTEINPCDFIDHLLARQFFGEADLAIGGVPFNSVLDASYYLTESEFAGPCVRAAN